MGALPIPSVSARPNECTRGHARPNTRAHARPRPRHNRSACALCARNTRQHGLHGGAAGSLAADPEPCRALDATGYLETIGSESW